MRKNKAICTITVLAYIILMVGCSSQSGMETLTAEEMITSERITLDSDDGLIHAVLEIPASFTDIITISLSETLEGYDSKVQYDGTDLFLKQIETEAGNSWSIVFTYDYQMFQLDFTEADKNQCILWTSQLIEEVFSNQNYELYQSESTKPETELANTQNKVYDKIESKANVGDTQKTNETRITVECENINESVEKETYTGEKCIYDYVYNGTTYALGDDESFVVLDMYPNWNYLEQSTFQEVYITRTGDEYQEMITMTTGDHAKGAEECLNEMQSLYMDADPQCQIGKERETTVGELTAIYTDVRPTTGESPHVLIVVPTETLTIKIDVTTRRGVNYAISILEFLLYNLRV